MYGAAKPAFSLDTHELISGDVLTGSYLYSTEYDVTNADSRGVGTYDVTVSGVSNANYTIDFVKGTLTVTVRKVSVAWDFTSVVYDKSEHLPVATVGNKAFAGDEVTPLYNTDLAEVGVGAYSRIVTGLTGAEAGNYTLSDVTGLTNAWSITAREITVKVNDVNITYGGAKPAFSLDTSALIAGDSLSGEVGYLNSYDTSSWSSRKVGTYDITVNSAKKPSNPNYSVTFAKGTLTVSPLPVVLSWNVSSYEYDGNTHLPSATIVNTIYDLDEYVTVRYDNSIQRKSAGEYSRTATGFNVPALYGDNFTLVGGTNVTHLWSITRKAVEVKVNDLAVTYGDTPNYTLDTSALCTGDTLSGTAVYQSAYDPTNASSRAVGEYDVTVTGVSNPNYTITFRKGKLTVNPKSVTVKVNDSVVYFGDPKPAFTMNTSELLTGDSLTGTAVYSTSYVPGDADNGKVGNYAVSVTGPTNANYNINFSNGTLIVRKATRATVVVTISDIDEGDTLSPSVTSAIEEPLGTTVSYLYGKKDSSATPTATPPTEAGEYYVIAHLSASANYREADSSARYFTIRSV